MQPIVFQPIVFIIACPLIAVFILWAVYRVVKGANQRVSTARSHVERAKVKVETAERIANVAREQHKNVVTVAQQAMTQTGEALHVAKEITRVGQDVTVMKDQMDALIGFVAEGMLPRGRHARDPIPEVSHENTQS
jgi:hypothetical protein